MWLKGGPGAHSGAFQTLYASESRFYAHVAPLLAERCAHTYYVADGSDGAPAYTPIARRAFAAFDELAVIQALA